MSKTVGASSVELLALINDFSRLKEMDGRLRRARWIEEGQLAGTAEVELDVVFSNVLITQVVGKQRFFVQRLENHRNCTTYLCRGDGGSAYLTITVADGQDSSRVKLSGWVRARHPGARAVLIAMRTLVAHLINRSLHRTLERTEQFLAAEFAADEQ